VATAKDARSQRVDPLACGDAIDPPELAVPPDAGGSACNVSVSVETDLLDIVVKHPGNGVSVVAVKGLYAAERGSRPLIGVARIVSQSTPQCSSRRSR
jgi:hypothetical protein